MVNKSLLMKQQLTLPHRFFFIGLGLLVPFAILGFMNLYNDFEFGWLSYKGTEQNLFTGNQNFTDEIALSGTILALLFMSFARTKKEDEFIQQLRLRSWHWAILANFIFTIIGIWAVYGSDFISFMIHNMLTILIFFLLRFLYLLYSNRSAKD